MGLSFQFRGLARAACACLAAVVTVLLAGPVLAQSARLVTRSQDWTAYAHEGAAQKICFAVSAPKGMQPAAAKRSSAYFYLSAWPKDGVKSEVSVKLGYPLKKGSAVTVTIGSAAFRLFVKDDKAFVENPAEELALVAAMKKGSTMIVQGTSARGTATIDTYSLAGLSHALQSLAQSCP